MNTYYKIAVLQIYIHWLKGREINVDPFNIDLGKLEYLYQIAKKNLSEYGLMPNQNTGFHNFSFTWG